MDAANWTTIVVALVSAVGGGAVGSLIDLKKFNRKQTLDDKWRIIEDKNEENKSLRERIGVLENKVDALEREKDEYMLKFEMIRKDLIVLNAASYSDPFPFWIKSLDGNILYVNSAFEKEFDLQFENIFGKSEPSKMHIHTVQTRQHDRVKYHLGVLDRSKSKKRLIAIAQWPYLIGDRPVGVARKMIPEDFVDFINQYST